MTVVPRIALVMGDPAGIGPELTARLLARVDGFVDASVIAISDRRVLAQGARIAGVDLELTPVNREEPIETAVAD
jgi:4-hydroxy-L-threonine phosphate dehydrogenase PdxA